MNQYCLDWLVHKYISQMNIPSNIVMLTLLVRNPLSSKFHFDQHLCTLKWSHRCIQKCTYPHIYTYILIYTKTHLYTHICTYGDAYAHVHMLTPKYSGAPGLLTSLSTMITASMQFSAQVLYTVNSSFCKAQRNIYSQSKTIISIKEKEVDMWIHFKNNFVHMYYNAAKSTLTGYQITYIMD